MSELFEGTVEECVRHYSSGTWSRDHDAFLLQHLRVAKSTYRAWVQKDQRVVGQNRTMLMYFLDAIGYKLTDIPRDAILRDLGRAVFFGIVTMEETARELGYPPGSSKDTAMLTQALLGRSGMKSAKMRIAHQINERLHGDIADKLQRFNESKPQLKRAPVVIQRITAQEKPTVHPPAPRHPVPDVPRPKNVEVSTPVPKATPVHTEKTDTIRLAVNYGRQFSLILQSLSPEERNQFVARFGEPAVEKLATLLFSLWE